MSNQREVTASQIAGAVTRLVILLGLCAWAFWFEVSYFIKLKAAGSSETAHALVAPIAILLLVYFRRTTLVKNLRKGSAWGFMFIVAGGILYAVTIWPFSFGYIRYLALIPVLTGVVLVACGRRVLKLSLPMLLLLLLSIPMGARIYAKLIIRPETYTIAATSATLDQLPGVDTWVEGVDLFFSSEQNSGIIALGESNRGARLLLAFAAVGAFVMFSRIRSPWRVAIVMAAAVPIVLLCNFLRLLCWALVSIYTNVGPTSPVPRSVSAVCSLIVLYGLTALVCSVKLNLFVEANEEDENSDTREVCDV